MSSIPGRRCRRRRSRRSSTAAWRRGRTRDRAGTRRAPPGPRSPGTGGRRRSSPQHRLAVELDDQHAEAGVGGRRARTAVTVVLPTPPLPATIVTREAVSSGTGSTHSGGTFAQTSDRPARALRRADRAVRAVRRPTPGRTTTLRRSSGPVDVLQVSGLIDPIVVDAIDEAIERSDADGAQALILQMNTPRRGRRPRAR